MHRADDSLCYRVYAFDGEQFRTVWALDNAWDSTIDIDDSAARFSVHRTLREAPWSRTDVYEVTAIGAQKAAR